MVECFVGDNSPGSKMMCNIKKSVCDKGIQGEMVACAMKEAKIHAIDMAKMMSQLGHLSLLGNILAVTYFSLIIFILACTINRHN